MGGWIWADRRGLVSEALRLRGLATTAAVTMRSGMLEHPAVLRPLAVQAEVLLPPPGIPRSCRRPFQFLSRLMARRDSTGIWVTSRLDHGSNPRRRSAICGARFSSERGFERRAVLVLGFDCQSCRSLATSPSSLTVVVFIVCSALGTFPRSCQFLGARQAGAPTDIAGQAC